MIEEYSALKEINEIYYTVTVSFTLHDFLGLPIRVTESDMKQIITEINKELEGEQIATEKGDKIKIKFTSLLNRLDNKNKGILKQLGYKNRVIEKIEKGGFSGSLLFDTEVLERNRIFIFKSNDSLKFEIHVGTGDSEIKIPGYCGLVLLVHNLGAAAISLILRIDVSKINNFNLEKVFLALRQVVNVPLMKPIEATKLLDMLKKVANIRELNSAYFSISDSNGNEVKYKSASLFLLRKVYMPLKRIANEYFKNKYTSLLRKHELPLRLLENTEFLLLRINKESTKSIRNELIPTINKLLLHDKVNEQKIFNSKVVDDVRKETELYVCYPFILEFDFREDTILDEIIDKNIKIPDTLFFFSYNIVSLLRITLRELYLLVDEWAKLEIQRGISEAESVNELLLLQRYFFSIVEDYDNIKLIDLPQYERIYDYLKKEFRVEKYFKNLNMKLNMLSEIKARQHYVSLKRGEVTKKKLLLTIQIFATMVTTLSVLNLIVHQWKLISFENLSLEILMYIGALIYVISISLFMFSTIPSYTKVTQYINLERKVLYPFTAAFLVTILISIISLAMLGSFGVYIHFTASLVSLALWFIHKIIFIDKKVKNIVSMLNA
ncbi:MAG: hypothetical protein ACP6IS_10020 [Candidatus Asgardarchaeia archaeon]